MEVRKVMYVQSDDRSKENDVSEMRKILMPKCILKQYNPNIIVVLGLIESKQARD